MLNNDLLDLLMFYILPVVPKNLFTSKIMCNLCSLRQERKSPCQVQLILGLQQLKILCRKNRCFHVLNLNILLLQIQSSEELACWVLKRVIKFHTY